MYLVIPQWARIGQGLFGIMLFSLLGAMTVPAARAQTLDALYEVSLAGLPIGSATLASTFNGDTYRVEVRAKLTGLAGLLVGGKGAGVSSGTAGSNGRVQPSSYALNSVAGSGTVVVRMALNQGSVAAVEITPPLDPNVERVPLNNEHRRGILDPVSALLMPAPAKGATDPSACNRTLPVFDGAGRFDVALTFSNTKTVSIPGYSGPVVICSARYVPIAGHRPNRKSTRFMAENKNMEAWLVPVEGGRFLLPFRIQVKTMIGDTVIEAVRLTANGKTNGDAASPEPAKN